MPQIAAFCLEFLYRSFQRCTCHKRGGFVVSTLQAGNCLNEIRGDRRRRGFRSGWSFRRGEGDACILNFGRYRAESVRFCVNAVRTDRTFP
jgi:hypothetical protein